MTLLEPRIVGRIAEVDAQSWNALTGGRYPPVRHEFLHCMEAFGCLGDEVGWRPCHLLFEDQGRLAAAMPMYLKFNSFGEFVFDHAWANAYERAGQAYYPKLVVASPFTPATGPRLLLAEDCNRPEIAEYCIEAALDTARSLGVSSCHWLFADDETLLHAPVLLKRQGYQFHWRNRGYEDFEHYLSFLNSRRRKQIRKERREVAQAGVSFRRVFGAEMSDREWAVLHGLYRTTFRRYGNYPAMTLEFFRELGRRMGESVMTIFAERQGEVVAASFFLVGKDALYGRYWGCFQETPSLHFEACYYQGLDFCIASGFRLFEPGAQGEHKISRGFLPTPTYSLHWIADPNFRRAIADYLVREKPLIENYMEELGRHSPFRQETV
jgi:predicted N-acyltransferase